MTKFMTPFGKRENWSLIFAKLAAPCGVLKPVKTIKTPVAIMAKIATILTIANQNSTSPKNLTAIKLTKAKIVKKTS